MFGQFLGVDVKTVRSWEQGLRVPSGLACRFLEEIQVDLDHWRARLARFSPPQNLLRSMKDRVQADPP